MKNIFTIANKLSPYNFDTSVEAEEYSINSRFYCRYTRNYLIVWYKENKKYATLHVKIDFNRLQDNPRYQRTILEHKLIVDSNTVSINSNQALMLLNLYGVPTYS